MLAQSPSLLSIIPCCPLPACALGAVPQAAHDAAAGRPLPEAQRMRLLVGLNRRYSGTVGPAEAAEMTALLGAQHLFKCTVH